MKDKGILIIDEPKRNKKNIAQARNFANTVFSRLRKHKFNVGEKAWCLCVQDVEEVTIQSVHRAADGVWTYVVKNSHFLGGRDDDELFTTKQEAERARN